MGQDMKGITWICYLNRTGWIIFLTTETWNMLVDGGILIFWISLDVLSVFLSEWTENTERLTKVIREGRFSFIYKSPRKKSCLVQCPYRWRESKILKIKNTYRLRTYFEENWTFKTSETRVVQCWEQWSDLSHQPTALATPPPLWFN